MLSTLFSLGTFDFYFPLGCSLLCWFEGPSMLLGSKGQRLCLYTLQLALNVFQKSLIVLHDTI